ncbi:MAG: CPBP family intramembrane glutamic endopeptidase [Methanosarcinales archaeon]
MKFKIEKRDEIKFNSTLDVVFSVIGISLFLVSIYILNKQCSLGGISIIVYIAYILITILPFFFLGTKYGISFLKNINKVYLGFSFSIISALIIATYNYVTVENLKLFWSLFCFVFLMFFTLFLILILKNKDIGKMKASNRDVLILLMIFLITQSRFVSIRIFNIPEPYRFNFDLFYIWLGINLVLFIFLVIRGFEREKLGYSLGIGMRDFSFVLFGLVVSLTILMPVGVIFGYTELPGVNIPKISELVVTFTYYTFIISLSEEIMFRGLILNFVKDFLRRDEYALLISSLLFALVHIQKGIYSLASTFILGIILGYIYLRTLKLTASIYLHGILDVFGHLIFV